MEETSFTQKRKIVAITMVKNEMDIIESFVRHTLSFSDLLIVADHKSTDRTREILEALRSEGLPVVIKGVPVARHAQAETMTRLLWEAADVYHADLIVPLDADEFLVPTGEMTVQTILQSIEIEEAQPLCLRPYLPIADDGIPTGVFPFSVALVCNTQTGGVGKLLVNGDIVRREHARLSEGNHALVRPSGGPYESVFHAFLDGMELAHFYWRSPEQIQSKYAVGWPNIAAKYGRNTITGGGYRYFFRRIHEGWVPEKFENQNDWKPCKIPASVPIPSLRYSANTMPNVLANVMAASAALADELAETRALSNNPLVTTIVPYLGGGRTSLEDELFAKSLSSALAEDYPWHEILIPVVGNVIRRSLIEEAVRKGVKLVTLDHLVTQEKGAYVEWLLPGETVHPGKLRGMVTCFELQDHGFLMMLSGTSAGFSNELPYLKFDVGERDAFQAPEMDTLRREFLKIGRVPSCGMAGLLVRREVFEACGGLVPRFSDGRLHVFQMWDDLFQASEKWDDLLGVLRDEYAGTPRELSLEEIAMHQMDWSVVLTKYRDALDPVTQNEVEANQQNAAHALLRQAADRGIDLQSSIWPAYQQMLATLEKERGASVE